VPKSSVPKFRPGADFKAIVNGDKKKVVAGKR
jgi:nucleoid DNA-binding protein